MEPNTAKTETLSSVEAPFFGNTKDGKAVYDREDGSHFHTEGGMSPELLASALSIIDTKDRPLCLNKLILIGQSGSKPACRLAQTTKSRWYLGKVVVALPLWSKIVNLSRAILQW